jgi:hypothetical protein
VPIGVDTLEEGPDEHRARIALEDGDFFREALRM